MVEGTWQTHIIDGRSVLIRSSSARRIKAATPDFPTTNIFGLLQKLICRKWCNKILNLLYETGNYPHPKAGRRR